MANGAPHEAVVLGSQLGDIGFSIFTAQLITDTFDALVGANLRQQQAYVELLEQTGKSLTDYVNDTKDDIGPAEILQVLSHVAPPNDVDADAEPTKVRVGGNLSGHMAQLQQALLPDETLNLDDKSKLSESDAETIMDAVARRIAADKYALLQEMVRQGMVRLVVENGTIETRLNFRTYGSDFLTKRSHSAHRDSFAFRAKARTGGILSKWVKASAAASYNSINVSTVDVGSSSYSRASVDIFGGVTLNFRTDYQPLREV